MAFTEDVAYFGVEVVELLDRLESELPELELRPLPELWPAEEPPLLERPAPEPPPEPLPEPMLELRPPPEPEGALLWAALPPPLPEPALPPLQPELDRVDPAPEELDDLELSAKTSRGISRRGPSERTSGALPPPTLGVESVPEEAEPEPELLPTHL